MNYLLLALTTVCLSAQSVFTKQYGQKNTNAPIIYTVMSALSAMLFFLTASGFKLVFDPVTVLYAFFFAVSYAAALLGLTIALVCGPLSLSSLIESYSLIIPTLFGIAFLGEPVKATMLVGFVLLVVSLFAVNYIKEDGTGKKLSKKWVVSIAVAFAGNGMCSTVQKLQQVATGGAYKNEFMVYALLMAAVMLMIAAVFSEKGRIKPSVKVGAGLAVATGLANGIVNLLVMVLGGRMSISLLFPVISAGGIILSSLVSIFLYKEKLSKLQLTGVAIGVISIVFLNL